jgi:hypothetical protein
VADRDEQGRWRRGGASPNAGGRPKVVGDLRELARVHTPEALAVLVEVMNDRDAPAAARVAAAGHVLDRGYGKPAQSMEGRVEVQHNISDAAADVLRALSERARARRAEEARVIDAVAAPTTRQ